MQNVGRTDVVSYYGDDVICIPEEENILSLECKEIFSEDLDIGWLNTHARCINHCDNPDFKGFNCKKNPCFIWEFGISEIRRTK